MTIWNRIKSILSFYKDARPAKSFPGKWLADSQVYRAKCLEIAEQLRNGENPPFKRDTVYCKYVGNDNRSEFIAEKFASCLREKKGGLTVSALDQLQEYFSKFVENDILGQPKKYRVFFDEPRQLNGLTISPGTLRFVKVLYDLMDFPSSVFSGPRTFVEIGAGYGGQCKIIRERYPVNYTLIDIPEALELSSAYLKRLSVYGVQFINCEEPIPVREYDLCISDYCLGELDDAGIAFYVENVIRHCRYGYFTVHESVLNKVMVPLAQYFDLKVQYEEPQTHVHHKNHIIKAYRK